MKGGYIHLKTEFKTMPDSRCVITNNLTVRTSEFQQSLENRVVN